MPETTTDPKPRKKAGAPLKNAPGRVPYHEVDRLLVFGELVDGPEGEPPFVVYPSFRAIARRYGVNHSVIAGYAKRRDCLKRREQAQQRVTARVDDKLVEQRATEVAVGKGDAVRVIDTFIKGFEQALEDGRVRMDNPADFNTMLRLKEFLLGGPDARQEVHASLSLEELQRRHARMMSVTGDVNADAVVGVVPGRRLVEDDGRELSIDSPAGNFDGPIAELHGHSGDQADDDDVEDDPFAMRRAEGCELLEAVGAGVSARGRDAVSVQAQGAAPRDRGVRILRGIHDLAGLAGVGDVR